MKKLKLLVFLNFFFVFFASLYSQESPEIISVYEDSRIMHDDRIGYEDYYIFVEDDKVEVITGIIRRRACIAPTGRSPLEIARNYQRTIEDKGGKIIYSSRNPRGLEADGKRFWDYYSKERVGHTRNYEYMRFPNGINEYIVGKIPYGEKDIYVILGAGNPDGRTIFELITVEIDEIELDKVSINSLKEGIATLGRARVYDIYFDLGSAAIREESSEALEIIAKYLNENANQRFLVVGHTDNTGNFDMNISLSLRRAQAVVDRLVQIHNVKREQLKAYGIGSTSPVSSNSTDNGRARNRRVEIVEY